jgi:hypothetical protein
MIRDNNEPNKICDAANITFAPLYVRFKKKTMGDMYCWLHHKFC